MSKFYILLISIIIVISVSSCDKSQTAPSYVYIPEIIVEANYGINGSSSSKITNVKVFNGNDLIGVYELPINVPIIDFSKTNIKCFALINNSGLSSFIQDYPFYNLSSNDLIFESEKQDTINPVVTYISTSSADYWYEDFEGAGHAFTPGTQSNALLSITENPSEVFEGSGSGSFDLSADTAYSKYYTIEEFNYTTGKPAYLELDYKNNQEFFFSLILRPENQADYKMPVFQFNPTTDDDGEIKWNKIYIDIGTLLNGLGVIQSFDICFEMSRNTSVSNPVVLIDNVKVIKGK